MMKANGALWKNITPVSWNISTLTKTQRIELSEHHNIKVLQPTKAGGFQWIFSEKTGGLNSKWKAKSQVRMELNLHLSTQNTSLYVRVFSQNSGSYPLRSIQWFWRITLLLARLLEKRMNWKNQDDKISVRLLCLFCQDVMADFTTHLSNFRLNQLKKFGQNHQK